MIRKLHRDERHEKTPQKKTQNRKREHSCKTHLCLCVCYFLLIRAVTFFSVSAAEHFTAFVVFWRPVVFPNIFQSFDSISGMWSMTLVWNQRTTLENEGGGGKGSQGGAIGARQSTSARGVDYGRDHAHWAPAQLLRLPASAKRKKQYLYYIPHFKV